MDIGEYGQDVKRTEPAIKDWHDQLQWGVNGLCSEAGEVAGIFQKQVQGHGFSLLNVAHELGDVLYFVTYTAEKCGLTLDEIMQMNVEKRAKRYPAGVSAERSIHRSDA